MHHQIRLRPFPFLVDYLNMPPSNAFSDAYGNFVLGHDDSGKSRRASVCDVDAP
jgi:hypothetical protein